MLTFTFEPLKEANLPQLFDWLALPHVAEWWRESRDWQTFKKKYLNWINTDDVGPFFIYHEHKPIGYIQWALITTDPIRKELYPVGTYGIDIFIADLHYVGKGYGPEMIKQFIKKMLMPLKPTLIITDPEITNTRAIRAYEKLGFKKTIISKTTDGTTLVTAQIMELNPKTLKL